MLTEPFKKTGQLVTIYDEQAKTLSIHGPNGCKFVRKRKTKMKLYFKELLERISNRFGIGKNAIAKYLYGRTALAWDLEFEKQILLKQMKK